jgi:hypothetical protein
MCIALALGFQFGVAAKLVDSDNIAFTYLRDAWVDGCEEFEDDPDLQKSCAGNNGNYRASAATTLFFLLAAIAAACKPTANREAWPSKYILYLFLVAATIFIPNEPLFAKIFLNVARSKWRRTDLFERAGLCWMITKGLTCVVLLFLRTQLVESSS